MANENEFINGLIVKPPNENAPEYVKGKGSIKIAELVAWLQTRQGEWVNFDIKVSQGGKWYAAVDNWKPNGKASDGPKRQESASQRQAAPADDFPDDEIPF